MGARVLSSMEAARVVKAAGAALEQAKQARIEASLALSEATVINAHRASMVRLFAQRSYEWRLAQRAYRSAARERQAIADARRPEAAVDAEEVHA